ncbi:MAG: PIN domain-containing protein [Thermoanaerobaculia bacterium]
MKVLVDTSAWVDFLNGRPSPEAAALAALVAGGDELCTCGIVAAEVFSGPSPRPEPRRAAGPLSEAGVSGADRNRPVPPGGRDLSSAPPGRHDDSVDD